MSEAPGRAAPSADPAAPPPRPGRVLFGCVAEGNPRYLGQALRLVQSLRWLGGEQAAAPFAVGLVGEADPVFTRELERLGAELWPLPRYSPLHAHSNKLQLPRQAAAAGYEVVALLDCDTLVLRDPTPFLTRARSDGGLGAKIADLASVPLPLLAAVFAHFGRPLPPARYRTTLDREPTIAYCNTGVLLFSREARERLLPRWVEHNDRLLGRLELLGDRAVFCEQVSLALALAETPELLRELPPEMNLPLHLPRELVPTDLLDCDARIVHYHDRVDPESGLLRESYFPRVQARLADLNERLDAEARRAASNPRSKASRAEGREEARLEVGDRPLFLVGCMRSGTTLLAQLLGAHPRIAYCPFELKALWSRVAGCEMASPRTGDARCPSCGAAQASPERADALRKAFLEEYGRQAAEKLPGAWLLNKNPHLCNKLPYVRALFPAARFLALRRSLPAVVHSLRGLFAQSLERHGVVHVWPERDERGGARCWHCHPEGAVPASVPVERRFPGGSLDLLAEYWLESSAALEAFAASAAPGSWHALDEEELLSAPAQSLAAIQRWLGVELADPPAEPALEPARDEAWRAALRPEERAALRDLLARRDAGEPWLARSRAELA